MTKAKRAGVDGRQLRRVCCEKVKITQLTTGRKERKIKSCCYLNKRQGLKDTNKNRNERERLKH